MASRQRQNAISRRASESSNDYDGAFDLLSDRDRLIGSCLERAQSQRGMPPMGEGELLVKISDFAPALAEIPSYALAECFRLAVIGHDVSVPFQVSEIVKEWREMSETGRAKLFDGNGIQSLPSGPPCEWCNGKGLMRVKGDGKPVKWVSTADTAGVKRCWCREGGAEPEDCDVEVGLELVREIDFKSAVRGLLNRMPGAVDGARTSARRLELQEQARALTEVAGEEIDQP